MEDSLFNQDTVRDFMMAKGGKVRNHDLVSHFKSFLNDPKHKVANRQKFKTFVNLLSSVKLDESGEKVLVLKRKFRDGVATSEPTPAKAKSPQLHRPKKQKLLDSFPLRSPSPEKAEEEEEVVADTPAAPEEPAPLNESLEAAAEEAKEDFLSGPSLLAEIQSQMAELVEKADDPNEDTSAPSTRESSPLKEESSETFASVSRDRSPSPQRHSPQEELEEVPPPPPVVPPSTPPPQELSPPPPPPSGPVTEVITPETQKTTEARTPLSVKERASHLNKMTPEVDLQKPVAKQQKNHDDDDSIQEVISLSAVDREWILAAAAADYHPMNKLLVGNPQLAKRKDFISTPLHWACKHGQKEVVKMLCGTPDINVNARSGYTALHLAAMQGHEEVIEMLVQAYGADSNLRDYSGKKAKQYLRNSASTRAQQLLQNRRPSAHSAGTAAPFRRTGSYSTKIRSTGHFGIAAGTAVRNSWAQLNESERRGSQDSLTSPRASPRPSPQSWRKQTLSSSHEDTSTMPPPRDVPVRHRRPSSRRDNKENHSDSELGASGMSSGSESDLPSLDSAASYPNIAVQKSSYV